MKHVAVLLFVLALLSSCSVQIQKRLYRNGFYVNTSGQNPQVTNHSRSAQITAVTNERQEVIAISDSLATDIVETRTADLSDVVITKPHAASSRKDSSVVNHTPAKDPSPKTVDEQIKDLHKLDVATKISLVLWLTIIGTAIGIPASFVLSLIMVRRIKRLKRNYDLSEAQMAEVEKMRRHARAVLIISSILFALMLTALILLLFFPWSVMISAPILFF